MNNKTKLELSREIRLDIIFKMVADHLLSVDYRTYIRPLNSGGGVNFNGQFLEFPENYAKTFKIITVKKRGSK